MTGASAAFQRDNILKSRHLGHGILQKNWSPIVIAEASKLPRLTGGWVKYSKSPVCHRYNEVTHSLYNWLSAMTVHGQQMF